MERGNSAHRPLGLHRQFRYHHCYFSIRNGTKKMGHDVILGKGVADAQEILLEGIDFKHS